MRGRFLIIASFAGLILGVGIFLFFVWHSALKEEKAAEKETAETLFPEAGAGFEQPGESLAETGQKLAFAEPESPKLIFSAEGGSASGGKPFFKEEGEKIKETFLEEFSALIEPPVLEPLQSETKQTIEPEATSSEIILSLTKEEFDFLYPAPFISSLMTAQELFIKEYHPDYVPLVKIEDDAQIRLVEEKIVASLLGLGMITKEQADIYIKTIRFTLPKLQLRELQSRKSSGLNEAALKNMCFLSLPVRGLFLAGLIEKLRDTLILGVQAKACGHCYVRPLCFQVGVPMPIPGYNVFKAFCQCTGCYYGQGCLDFCTSEGGMSAIWDPMTGICGCG